MNAFVSDYANAKNRADTLDAKIMKDASAISPEYVSLASLAARQVFGATELTIGNGTDGQFNMTDVKMFMKNVGSIDPTERWVINHASSLLSLCFETVVVLIQ